MASPRCQTENGLCFALIRVGWASLAIKETVKSGRVGETLYGVTFMQNCYLISLK